MKCPYCFREIPFSTVCPECGRALHFGGNTQFLAEVQQGRLGVKDTSKIPSVMYGQVPGEAASTS